MSGIQAVTGLPPRIYTRECRTPSWFKECVSCKGSFHQMMFLVCSRHNNDSQWVIHGWQCFDCERKDREVPQ